jgi:hypothetical protein
LFLLLDLLNDADINLQDIGNGISRSQGKPLSKRDIGDAIALVEFNPNKLLGFRGVLNIVTWRISISFQIQA